MASDSTKEPGVDGKAGEPGAAAAGDETASVAESGSALPPVDFSTFVLSLGTTALYQMGLVQDPESGTPAEADPLVAQQTIDTLEMLRKKTLGNLDEEERRLFDSLLYELRMRFVEISR